LSSDALLISLESFREKYYNASRSIRTFREEHDWIQELERCGISYKTGAWRVLSMNHPSSENALPQHFVVPKHLTDSEYFEQRCIVGTNGRSAS
jgi:hypothetical protein